jgi:hypothetical protein
MRACCVPAALVFLLYAVLLGSDEATAASAACMLHAVLLCSICCICCMCFCGGILLHLLHLLHAATSAIQLRRLLHLLYAILMHSC